MKSLIKVMIADRDEDFRMLLKDALETEGDLRVTASTGNGAEAAVLAEKGAADVIVIDVILPELDGLGVLERISRLPAERRAACVVASSFDSREIIERAAALGAKFYLSKPFDIVVLAERIRQANTAPVRSATPETAPSSVRISTASPCRRSRFSWRSRRRFMVSW